MVSPLLGQPLSLTAVIAAGALLRLAIFAVAPISALLANRPEVSTPITSFRSLSEGVFLHKHGVDPYQGGVFHHSPLYLAFFEHVIPASSHLATCLLWLSIDVAGGLILVASSKLLLGSRRAKSRDSLVALVYLFNPYTLMTCLARSTTAIDNVMILLTFCCAAAGLDLMAHASLAVATHTSLYPVMLLPATQIILAQKSVSPVRCSLRGCLTYAASVGLLFAFNYWMTGTAWIAQTWGAILGVTDLTPNSGMWWYFFTEMFDHFRPFFLGVFHLHSLVYVVPICLRLRDEPSLAMALITGILACWKSYPCVGDLGLWAGLMSCFPEVTRDLRHPLFTLTVYLYTLVLLPLLHSLWLLTGTGNANFFYAATMVHGLNSCLAIVDVLGAGIRRRVKQSVDGKWDEDRWQVVQLNKVDR